MLIGRGLYAAGLVACCCLLLCCFTARADAADSPIDSIDLSTTFGYANTYSITSGGGLLVIGNPMTYHLHDGREWSSGVGFTGESHTRKSSVTVTGNQIDYILDLAVGSQVYYRIDYDGDDHSSGVLASTSQLALQAVAGSTTATLDGYAKITNDAPVNYVGSHFHYFNAPDGALVPFHITYILTSGTWQPDTMDSMFNYNLSGTLDFTQAMVPEPAGAAVLVPLVLAIVHRRNVKRGHQR